MEQNESKLPFLSKNFKYDVPSDLLDQNDIPISDSQQYTKYMVEFLNQSSRYAVGMVDMVNSSKISAQIGPKKSSRYYQVFLNFMSKIIFIHGGTVIKNVGDSLFYYFTNSEKLAHDSCIQCGLDMIRFQKIISQQLVREGLPDLDYRVSADYGTVLLMKTTHTESLDMIGSPVNMCAKINRLAAKNQFVIGNDLFLLAKELGDYKFKEINDFSLGFKQSYPVYSVSG